MSLPVESPNLPPNPASFDCAAESAGSVARRYFDIRVASNPRATPLQEMTRISELVTFLLGKGLLPYGNDGLPKRPCEPPAQVPKNEAKSVKAERKKIAARVATDLKNWDPIDAKYLGEIEKLRFLNAASSLSDSSKPSLGLRMRKMNIHNMNNARRIMFDYNDIMVESTGQELHEVLVPKVARFMYIKQHPTLRLTAWHLNKKGYEEFINTEARKLRKFGQDIGMPESTIKYLYVAKQIWLMQSQ
jgi:hypothetical protein